MLLKIRGKGMNESWSIHGKSMKCSSRRRWVGPSSHLSVLQDLKPPPDIQEDTQAVLSSYTFHLACVCVKSLRSYLTLRDPMDYSLPYSSVRRISQARILEWMAMPSSRGSSWPHDQTSVSCGSCIAGRFFTTEPPGKPILSTWSTSILQTSAITR